MTDEQNRTDVSPGSSTNATVESQRRQLSLSGIIAILLVAMVGSWAAYVFATGKGGFNWQRFTLRGDSTSEFVEVSGKITYNGRPLTQGQLEAYPLDGDTTKNAVSQLGEDGKYKFFTFVNGDLKWGMYPGEYKLVVNATYPLQAGQLAPTKMLGADYYSQAKTEVRMTVHADQDNTGQTIALKGEPVNPPPRKRAGGPPPGLGGTPSGKKQPPGGKRFNVAQLIERIMASDKDGDKKISREEASDRLKRNFDEIDTNKDGKIDRKELEARFQRRRKKRPKSPANGGQP